MKGEIELLELMRWTARPSQEITIDDVEGEEKEWIIVQQGDAHDEGETAGS